MPIFEESAQEAGLDFIHFNGMSGRLFMPEMVGTGAAVIDCDNDDDLDVFLVQGNVLGPGRTLSDMIFQPKGPLVAGRLYRNDLAPVNGGPRQPRFTDITVQSGIQPLEYGMGVAAGDYDNDGQVDLYVTGLGSNRMYHNKGNCTFEDTTARTGTDDPRWSVSAAFVDYDKDGALDLFVGNYIDFRFTNQKECFFAHGARDYCGPLTYPPLPNSLFRNKGDGTFEDVTARSRVASEYGGTLGVVCADFNGDGWPDIFVSNDGRPNQLWVNQKDGTFKNEASLAGCALNDDGKAEAGMGVDAGDYDNDGDEDVFITHLNGEKNTLYLNDGKGWFTDESYQSGLAGPSLPFTGFGTAFFDYDNDGWLDVLTVNGEVRLIEAQVRAKEPHPLKQRMQLFRNLANGRFVELKSEAGPIFQAIEVGRGAAFGDLDNDGDQDVVVVNNAGPARLLRNNAGTQSHWLGVRLLGGKAGRDMPGTRVVLFRPKGPPLWRRSHTDGSYASSNDPRVVFGLGGSTEVTKLRAHWPSGRVEEWQDLTVDGYHVLREGSGRKIE